MIYDRELHFLCDVLSKCHINALVVEKTESHTYIYLKKVNGSNRAQASEARKQRRPLIFLLPGLDTTLTMCRLQVHLWTQLSPGEL